MLPKTNFGHDAVQGASAPRASIEPSRLFRVGHQLALQLLPIVAGNYGDRCVIPEFDMNSRAR